MYCDIIHLNLMIKNINKKKETPFNMANEELADQFFPYIKKEFPEAIMIKLGIEQFITVNKRGQDALIKDLKKRKMEYEEVIKEINFAIEMLR